MNGYKFSREDLDFFIIMFLTISLRGPDSEEK